MDLEKYSELKKAYDAYGNLLLRQGKLLYKDTEKGIWGITPCEDLVNLFIKMGLEKYKTFLDIGSGDGRAVLTAALFGINAAGIEIDDELIKVSNEIKNKLKIKNAKFMKKDFFEEDFSKYDVLFINPDKGFHLGLEDKLLKELKGRLFVYNQIFTPRFLKKARIIWVGQMPVIDYTRN
ncbi:methyltransferase domain-containing protein [Candidatus Woesearchaeota archaeon]|nr:methyltransferase domain-containing protein [Candidatus Woesearchaeota archaeon]